MNRIGSEGVVVVEDGKRVVGPVHQDQHAADQAAEALRKKLLEQNGQSSPVVETKQQLFG